MERAKTSVMSGRRFHLSGLFAVLLALMAMLGAGATVPRIDPISGIEALCHPHSGAPAQAPAHGSDCLLCPLCGALHASPAILASAGVILVPPDRRVALKIELPPPSTAPPTLHRPPSQPRAPPAFS